uniref:Transposase n=1 Tax=Echinococcus granulosus TaxID=6210 RepID=A0A068WYU5_ECHGR|nr:hypothetical protein EgrG_002056700 [Echinococcus granulosus]
MTTCQTSSRRIRLKGASPKANPTAPTPKAVTQAANRQLSAGRGGPQQGRYHVYGCKLGQSVSQSVRQQASLLFAHHRLLRLLRQQHRLDDGQHTTLRDGHTAQQLVQLFIIADSQPIAGDEE